jgi:hypothetical protein
LKIRAGDRKVATPAMTPDILREVHP